MLESETEAVPQKKARRISAAPKDAHLRRRQSAKTSGSVSPTRGPTRKSPKRSRRAHNGASEVDEDHASESSDATLPRSPATGPARKSSRRSRQVQSDESAVDAGKVLGSSDTTLPGSPVRFPTRKSQIRSPVKFPAHESPRRSPVKFPNRKSLKKSVKLQTSKTSRRSRQPNNGASEVDADEASESSDTTLPRSPAKGLTRKLSRRPRQANNGASKFDEDQVSESSDATLPRSPAKGSARKSSKRSRQVQSDETEVDDISESSPVPMSPAPRRVRRSGYEVASVSRKKTSRVASSSDLDDVFEPVDNEGKKRRSSVRSVDGKQVLISLFSYSSSSVLWLWPSRFKSTVFVGCGWPVQCPLRPLAAFVVTALKNDYFLILLSVKKRTVFAKFFWPTRYHLRRLENSNCYNMVKSCKFLQFKIMFDD